MRTTAGTADFSTRFRLWINIWLAVGACALGGALASPAQAEIVTLRNGYQLEGKIGRISALATNPLDASADSGPELIVLVDDDLRRIFVPNYMVERITPVELARKERIKVEQRVAVSGSRISSVGALLKVEPFDEFGRRTVTMATGGGNIHVVQGITEVTPTYTRVEALAATPAYIWTSKIATSSIPRATLSKILRKVAGANPDQRLAIVRLYIQADRYNDASAELEECIKDFPMLAEMSKQVPVLAQAGADRLAKEIEQRRAAGQHELASEMAAKFPVAGIAGETRLKVRETLTQYEQVQEQGKRVLALLKEHLAALPDGPQKDELTPLCAEITAELNIHNLDRFADYLRLSDGDALKPDQKLSLALSGWLLGVGQSIDNLSIAQSLYDVRKLALEYLRSTREAQRADLIKKLDGLEGGSPSALARILLNMKPPLETPHDGQLPEGMFRLKVPGLAGQPDIEYFVQLPPEYNPFRRYPTIVTLHGGGGPERQIDWWAGEQPALDPKDMRPKMRLGQASRRGYIVIAPAWTKDKYQSSYEFSPREHAAVLFSLRDAFQRFSIDVDRVFLSGHSMGGDAAWDIALAHPDLWAGVMPIGAGIDKYIKYYWPNGKYVPLYYVGGEMDGDRFSKCAVILDKYLTLAGYDAVVVQYQGRGHEHFYDEIQELFRWMEIHKRNPLPKEFSCEAQRPWDNYFWWVELENYPPALMTLPAAWTGNASPNRGRTAQTEAKIYSSTSLSVKTAATAASIWLSPEMVGFENRFTIKFNGKDYPQNLQPSTAVMLEDARTRGDRQHPFWQKVRLGK